MDLLFLSKRIYIPDEDLLVNGGILITNDGKIRKVLKSPEAVNSYLYNTEAESIIDFEDKILMPGLIDPSVHINEPGHKDWEGFASATKSAAAGGFTTIADIPLNSTPPITTVDSLKGKTALARGKLYVDVAFWGGLVPGNLNDVWGLIRAGVVGIKCCLYPSEEDDFKEVGQNEVEAALKKMEGTGSVLAFHAEMLCSEKIQADEDNPKKFKSYSDTRPVTLEMNAVEMITALAAKYKLRTHILNLCYADTLPLINKCKKSGGSLSVETCHHFLALSSENIEDTHTEFKSAPPIRDRANQDKLWEAIQNKEIDLITSDHFSPTPGPRCLTFGRQRGDFIKARSGISSLQLGLSIFWTNAKKRGLGLKDVYRLLCLNPAKLCGLDHIKGKLNEGYDADFCVWDPDEEFIVGPEMLFSQNKATPYMGQKLRGTVHATVVRGLHVFQLYEGFGQPLGKVILRKTDRNIVKFA